MSDWVPSAFEAFKEYRMDAVSLSATGIDIVRRMLAGEEITQAASGMSAGEWREFQAVIAPR